MKKILLLIASIMALTIAVSCGDHDEPSRGDGVFTANTIMVNHMTNSNTEAVPGMASTSNKLIIDTVGHKASLELNYNDGSEKTLKISDIIATPKRLGFYELSSTSNPGFSGYVDFNESAMRYCYTTADGLRVISTMPDVYFLKTNNVVTYLDTTKSNTIESTMYQFNISPTTQTAIVKVMDIVHAKDLKAFINITAYGVPITVTADGYLIKGDNLSTVAAYRAYVDSTGSNIKKTDKYPFKTFSATIDLAHDRMEANYMIGDSAIVVANGRTYPDYTIY